jgi:hypothetical protein
LVVNVADVADVSEMHAASIFRVEDAGRTFLRNVCNIANVHTA